MRLLRQESKRLTSKSEYQSRTELQRGAIFEKDTEEIQNVFKYAMAVHNQNISTRRLELQAFVDVINTADAFKLSRLTTFFAADESTGGYSLRLSVVDETTETELKCKEYPPEQSKLCYVESQSGVD
ncbi:unnamed protein product [Pieris macdunnoughi]|uniref:Uncharacterized protein n=1 Tax=Pieris macdunnoughi TaxID=345717 RepID=A0A821LGJ2_9NEOP|nr:unnamed protein product [Pieris macdunnoughi]